MPAIVAAAISALTAAPELIKDARAVWTEIASLHSAGTVRLTADQLAAMNAAGVTLDADIASLDAAAGIKPAA